MKYLRISNRGSLNRKYLELIGLSTKRDRKADESVIGHKGSGTKLSAVAALRLGLDVAIASTDRWGRYLLTFDVEQIDIDGTAARQIHFNYANVVPGAKIPQSMRYPSGMVLEAFQDWDSAIGDDDKKSFKVLREFVCNAIDADRQCRIDVVDVPAFAADGETAVYLKYTEEIRKILLEVDRYFKFLSKVKPVFNVPAIGSIFPKSEPGEKGGLFSKEKSAKTRLFVQGVLVDCSDAYYRASLYDYSMHEKTLVSEERIIKNFSEYLSAVARLYGQVTDLEICKTVLAAIATGNAKLEEQALGQIDAIIPASKKVWLKVVHGLFGEKLAVSSGNSSVDKDCDQIMGYTVIGSASTYLRHFYAKLGLPKASDLVPTVKENMKFSLVAYRDLDADSRARFQQAFERFATYFPERAGLPIVFYHPLEENFRKIAGFSGIGDTKYKEIWIATATATSLKDSEEDLFHTLLHEGRHCETKADDYDRAFVRRADKEVIGLVYGRVLPPDTETPVTPNVVDPATRTKKGSPGPASAEPEADPLDDLELLLDDLSKDHQ
ncbi:MAG TPA: hypothetical protein VL500_02995 [Candidatus Eisenbacteria bacterium]|nr:hypothetical protein [Candidatus Eisenbacteria bacterium]